MDAVYDGCRAKGGFTSEAAQFYDTYSDLDGPGVKVKELVGVGDRLTSKAE
jgi:hypothetical protein